MGGGLGLRLGGGGGREWGQLKPVPLLPPSRLLLIFARNPSLGASWCRFRGISDAVDALSQVTFFRIPDDVN